MLFDAVTTEFIDVETLIFLCEGLVHTLTKMARLEWGGSSGAEEEHAGGDDQKPS
jgi:hypothetical protein